MNKAHTHFKKNFDQKLIHIYKYFFDRKILSLESAFKYQSNNIDHVLYQDNTPSIPVY
jgi:hypothetical protein